MKLDSNFIAQILLTMENEKDYVKMGKRMSYGENKSVKLSDILAK